MARTQYQVSDKLVYYLLKINLSKFLGGFYYDGEVRAPLAVTGRNAENIYGTLMFKNSGLRQMMNILESSKYEYYNKALLAPIGDYLEGKDIGDNKYLFRTIYQPYGLSFIQRTPTYTVSVTGQRKGFKSVEMYNAEKEGKNHYVNGNIYGALKSFGRIEIMLNRKSIADSGVSKEGFDYGHRNGQTVFHVPLKNLYIKKSGCLGIWNKVVVWSSNR